MIDYEKIAESVEVLETGVGEGSQLGSKLIDLESAAKITKETIYENEREGSGSNLGSDSEDPAALQARLNHTYLPVTHDKYQKIATEKGYKQGEEYSGNRLQKVSYSHEAMIDVIIAEPTITQAELAKKFGRTQTWISVVMGSDSFQAALAKRRDDLTDPFLVATIEERFRGLADQSLQVIAEKLEKSRNADLALKSLDISAKALGFGARGPAKGAAIQNNFVVQLPPKIKNSADWAKAHSNGTVLEG